MKDVITSKKTQEKEGQLIVRNANKIAQAEVTKTSSLMNLDGKYIWVINNIDFDAAKDLGLTGIKKHQRLTSQIKKEVDGLYKDQILALPAFVKYFQKINNNKQVTEKMKIRQDIDLR